MFDNSLIILDPPRTPSYASLHLCASFCVQDQSEVAHHHHHRPHPLLPVSQGLLDAETRVSALV